VGYCTVLALRRQRLRGLGGLHGSPAVDMQPLYESANPVFVFVVAIRSITLQDRRDAQRVDQGDRE